MRVLTSALRAVRRGWVNGHPFCRVWFLVWCGLGSAAVLLRAIDGFSPTTGIDLLFVVACIWLLATMPDRATMDAFLRRLSAGESR